MLEIDVEAWLSYRKPYDTPKPRDESYYSDLQADSEKGLREGLLSVVSPYDRGKQEARLDWVEGQVEQLLSQGSQQGNSSVSNISLLKDAYIQGLSGSLGDEIWQYIKTKIQPALSQLSTDELNDIKDFIKSVRAKYQVDYLRECSEAYNEPVEHREQILSKQREIKAFLMSRGIKNPTMSVFERYLKTNTSDSRYPDALKLQEEYSALHPTSQHAVVYRISEKRAMTSKILIEQMNSSGFTSQTVNKDNIINIREGFEDSMIRLVLSTINDKAGIANSFKENPLFKSAMGHCSAASRQYILEAIDECATYIYKSRATIDEDEILRITQKLVDTLIEENHQFRSYFGAECHVLSQSSGAYAVGGTGHTLDKNMIWMLSNIHQGRPFELCSNLSMDTIMRQTPGYENDPSAFAVEISALMGAGYQVTLNEGRYSFEPPRTIANHLDHHRLGGTSLRDVLCDISSEPQKAAILANVDQALTQQQRCHERVIERIAVKYHQKPETVADFVDARVKVLQSGGALSPSNQAKLERYQEVQKTLVHHQGRIQSIAGVSERVKATIDSLVPSASSSSSSDARVDSSSLSSSVQQYQQHREEHRALQQQQASRSGKDEQMTSSSEHGYRK